MRRRTFMTAAMTAAATLSAALADGASAGELPAIALELVADGLTRPIGVVHAPDDYRRVFIIEKHGTIRIWDRHAEALLETPFLDLTALVGGGDTDAVETGLLGVAFHPDYAANGQLFVNYTDLEGDTTVMRHVRGKDPNQASPQGEIVLSIEQPFQNHNGGWMAFGPDGYLYIAVGDGGLACDPDERAQDTTGSLLGKILRIDVDHDGFPAYAQRNYAIPPDNPFAGGPGDDEIWAYGLRNPWRNAFDRATGDLYLADVGQIMTEEINVQPGGSPGGENYGWDCMEGTSCANFSGCPISEPGTCECSDGALTDPVVEYPRGGNPFRCAIIGGAVYRGCAIPALGGHYFYGDFCSGEILSLRYDGRTVREHTNWTAQLRPPGKRSLDAITSFGEDALGELYVCDQDGEVFRIAPVTRAVSPFDFDCDGAVDVNDLVTLITAWGDCDACREDVNGDGTVDVTELVMLILEWG